MEPIVTQNQKEKAVAPSEQPSLRKEQTERLRLRIEPLEARVAPAKAGGD